MRIVCEVGNQHSAFKYVKHPTLAQYNERVIRFLDMHKPSHFGHVVFYDKCSLLALEDMLNDWMILVNRSYVGRQWYTPERKYRGMLAFSETFTSAIDKKRNAFLLIREPLFSDSNEFVVRAAALFRATNETSVAPRREMTLSHVATLGTSPVEVARSFVAKLDQKWPKPDLEWTRLP